jgi:RNA polymerase sigma-70 factor (ECF subfamily)
MTANDPHAEYDLEALWTRFSARLRAFVQSRVSDPATTEDILQEVFIRVHRHLCCQPGWNKPDSWFYQIARNLIIDHYRRRRELVELSDSTPADSDLPEDDPEAELALSLKAMIDELPEPYRQALILTEYQGLSQKQLAESQGISLSGAKSRVQRARDRLRDLLLQCCHFEIDRRGGIIDYYEHCCCCQPASTPHA